ncbi:adenosine receptor A3 [Cimex lectularius]|uniref:G-protein coupled receptors family 1 profile domain-containing protein n=1 Tax=Cimex lectularius TaxID=79782 RepID=A0A8I6RHH2_CIMLE|nr:adenosine receptor A3 [Cimex lectularius]
MEKSDNDSMLVEDLEYFGLFNGSRTSEFSTEVETGNRTLADDMRMNTVYTICEVSVGCLAVVGNTLVILAFKREKRLRRLTNYYIVSLAIADLLVGLLGIPCALLSKVGLPKQLYLCLTTLSLLVLLCTISIFSLVAVSVDRYWAILYPMAYARNVTSKTAIYIICLCWVLGTIVGFLPLLGWNNGMAIDSPQCHFTEVMDYNFLVFLYLATIVFPALLMAAFYAHIYSVVLKQLRQMVTINGMTGGGSMLRVLGAARKRDVKATKNLSIIVLFFVLCWFPLYTINFIQAFCPMCQVPELATNSCIILSHLNSAGNPLLYAYHLTDFRTALRSLLTCAPVEQQHRPHLINSTVRQKIIYKIPASTPKLPHRIYNVESVQTQLESDYKRIGARCSVDSSLDKDGTPPRTIQPP